MNTDDISDEEPNDGLMSDESAVVSSEAEAVPFFLEPQILRGEDGELLLGLGYGVGLQFMQSYFPRTKRLLRIASSYFKLDTYKQCCSGMDKNAEIQVLVGEGNPQKINLAGTITENFRAAVEGELGRTTVTVHEAVQSILNRIDLNTEDRKFFQVRGARQVTNKYRQKRFATARFHCKFYLQDDELVLRGSANFTTNGTDARGNDEGIEASRDTAFVQSYTRHFNAVYSLAEDLLEPLEQVLRAWLNMALPFQAYLKALHCWYGQEFPPIGPDGHEPTYYQQSVIARVVGQVAQHQGALVLVATGLGKTIIGSEVARRLLSPFSIKRVIIIAPRVVERQWKKQLSSRGLSTESFFDNGMLFKADIDDEFGQKQLLLHCLEQCNSETVVLVDESHRYRKVLLKKEASQQRRISSNVPEEVTKEQADRVIRRFRVAADKGAKIVLLTATPYGTDLLNVNSLLYLLPHTTPAANEPPKHLLDFPEQRPSKTAWSIKSLERLASLPVVTVLGMFHVLKAACARQDVENNRVFIAMPQKPNHYLPKKILLYRVTYTLFLEQQITEVYDKKAFDAKRVPLTFWSDPNEKAEFGTSDASKNNLLYAWQSSPREMARVVRFCRDAPDRPQTAINSKNSVASQTEIDFLLPGDSNSQEADDAATDTAKKSFRYKADFIKSQRTRHRLLAPVLEQIEAMTPDQDPKFQRLVETLSKHPNHKIIVFVKRHSTALYLENECSNKFPTRRFASTVASKVMENGKGVQGTVYHLKTSIQRGKLVICFAPTANKELVRKPVPPDKQHDVLICTDADGIGLNMQDACVVINYDLPTGADELLQRAGRVTRVTVDPDREIYIYSFVPEAQGEQRSTLKKIRGMLDKLEGRHETSKNIIGGGAILPSETDDDPVAIPLATELDIAQIPEQFSPLEDAIASEQDSTLAHYARWDKYKERPRIPGPVLSAKNFSGKHPLILVLIEGNTDPFRLPFHILYNIHTKQLDNRAFEGAMDLLWTGNEQEEKAPISPEVVEAVSIEALRAWWKEQHPGQPFPESTEDYNRICSVYFLPRQSQTPEQAVSSMYVETLGIKK